jgi:hypothetical protein
MVLSKAQQSIWERSRAIGTGGQAVMLTDAMCAYLVGRIILDLRLHVHFPEIPLDLPEFYAYHNVDEVVLPCDDSRGLFERLVGLAPDADTYYACLATLHKARLKYQRILQTQPISTLEQVGPRALLQYGQLSPRGLAGLLFWRKWFFDIDNRAGQETGYLFEPIIAHSIGGVPAPAGKSPVKRHRARSKGRQIDCVLQQKAYEFKIRVTIAASGQGRWREEIDYPIDCQKSGFVPVLVVLDSTPNPKLAELVAAFQRHGGETYLGNSAWQHLESLAGVNMAMFLEKYVRTPLDQLLKEATTDLPDFAAHAEPAQITLVLGEEKLLIERRFSQLLDELPGDEMPDDVEDELPG